MKALRALSSPLAGRIVQFIAFKRMQGYEYNSGADELGRFDRFLTETGYARRVLDLGVLERFADHIATLSHSSRAGRLSTVRRFSVYLHALAPESAVLPERLVPRAARSVRFYPLSGSQVADLMAATATLRGSHELRAECIRLLIGLLYCTGLRISEALALNLGDVHSAQSTLLVRRGKFRKERLVPMSASTREAVDRWLLRRAKYAGSSPNGPLFVTGSNRRLSRDRAYRVFRRLCSSCGFAGPPPPRLHDLRHNYACACIARWRQAQEDLDALLPVLTNAMGHCDYQATQIYLHINAAALQQASERFGKHVRRTMEPSP
jgi:site-specific recombinase XerD